MATPMMPNSSNPNNPDPILMISSLTVRRMATLSLWFALVRTGSHWGPVCDSMIARGFCRVTKHRQQGRTGGCKSLVSGRGFANRRKYASKPSSGKWIIKYGLEWNQFDMYPKQNAAAARKLQQQLMFQPNPDFIRRDGLIQFPAWA